LNGVVVTVNIIMARYGDYDYDYESVPDDNLPEYSTASAISGRPLSKIDACRRYLDGFRRLVHIDRVMYDRYYDMSERILANYPDSAILKTHIEEINRHVNQAYMNHHGNLQEAVFRAHGHLLAPTLPEPVLVALVAGPGGRKTT